VFLVKKKHAAFKWKDAIFGFPVSPGNAEAQVTWSGKIKYILIVYFLGNTSAKNYRNQAVYAKIIANQRWDVFWDTVYIHFLGFLPLDGILRRAKFTLHPSLAFSDIGSVTAWHSSSGRQRKFAASYKEWNYKFFASCIFSEPLKNLCYFTLL